MNLHHTFKIIRLWGRETLFLLGLLTLIGVSLVQPSTAHAPAMPMDALSIGYESMCGAIAPAHEAHGACHACRVDEVDLPPSNDQFSLVAFESYAPAPLAQEVGINDVTSHARPFLRAPPLHS